MRVIANRYPRHLPEQEVIDGVAVLRWLLLTPRIAYLLQGRLDLFIAAPYFSISTRRHLKQIFGNYQPQVVNVHFPDHQVPFVLWLRQNYDFRLVIHLQGHEILRWFKGDEGRTMKDQRGLRQLRAILQEADAVTACSGWLLGKAVELEPSVAAKGRVIHNGVDLERFQDRTPYRHPRSYILAYGRLTCKKGFDMLLDAFAQIPALTPDVDLILAGSGEEEAALRRQAQRLGLGNRVHFFGRATPEEVVQLLNGCRFVVVPSREEPFGIVALEGLAAGKPVLATRVGGLPEVVGERRPTNDERPTTGNQQQATEAGGCEALLVEPTVAGLAEGLRTCLDRLDEMPDWGEGNRQRAAWFTWERVADQYMEVYRCRR